MISKRLAIDVLNESLATGADYAEVFFEDSFSNTINIDNGKVEVSTSNSISGVGLRLLKDNQCVYGYTNNLSKKGLFELANSLNKSFNGKRLITVSELNMVRCKNRNPIEKSYETVSKEERIQIIRKGLKAIEDLKDPRIVRYMGVFGDNHRFVAVFNSKGKWFKRDSEFGRLVYQVVVMNQNGIETGFEGPGVQDSIDAFKTRIDPKEKALKAAKTALLMLDAKECPSGKMPVVIGNGWGGVLFHESCGHPLEASAAAKGLSCFSGKIGEMIASPIVTAIDDAQYHMNGVQ